MNKIYRFIDIGANLTDTVFEGFYNGKKAHNPDLSDVLNRAKNAGLDKIIVTGGDLDSSKLAAEHARNNSMLSCTVGCHPTRCDEFEKSGDANEYLASLAEVMNENKENVVALGECGLDYDRLQFCDKNTQKRYFEKQLELNEQFKLPLFLHLRNAADDFLSIMRNCDDSIRKGVVHSFTDTKEVLYKLLDMGFYIGINGCSLKSNDNLEIVKKIPIDRMMIETDCPYCQIRPTHAGFKYIKTSFDSRKKEKWDSEFMVKGRNEPCTIIQVMEVLSSIRNEDPEELSKQIYENTEKLFFK